MKIAVLGCGTIGRGVVDILLNNVNGLELSKILEKKEKFIPELEKYFTDNADEIFADKEIETVVEVMGGRGFSYTCVKKALESGKNVVTANKELVAYYINELSQLADKMGVYFMYEASVGGGIPFIKSISNLSEINKTNKIFGILNGTTNYILTKMQKENLSYSEALFEAQRLGFAEANPSADVEGHDMVRKIAIISDICYKQNIEVDSVYHYGMDKVTKRFIDFANKLGYTLKYACFSELSDSIEIGVEPVLVKNEDIISGVVYENNIVSFDMVPNDKLTFIGKGAGRKPTAAAIVSDILVVRDKGQKMSFKNENNFPVKMQDKLVSAIIERNGEIEFVENVSANEVRNTSDFYAIVY